MSPAAAQLLMDKIRRLPPETVAQVEDFVDFLQERAADRALTRAAARISERAFERVWDNPEDADYDAL